MIARYTIIITTLLQIASVGLLYGQDGDYPTVDIDVDILNTGAFTPSAFNNSDIVLWKVDIVSQHDDDFRIYIKLKFNKEGTPVPLIESLTKPILMQVDQTTTLTNADFNFQNLYTNNFNQDWFQSITENGYLSAGTYSLELEAYFCTPVMGGTSCQEWTSALDEVLLDWASDSGVTGTTSLQNEFSNQIEINGPKDGDGVSSFTPEFIWQSPGFREGVVIEYKIIVARKDPDGTDEDAFSDNLAIYFETEWGDSDLTIVETGDPQQIKINYDSSDRALSCGHEYVWQVFARELIDENDVDPDFTGSSGLWGWPEPIDSPIERFSYGSSITTDDFRSPANGDLIATLLPQFDVVSPFCTEGFHVQVASDAALENLVYEDEDLGNQAFTYPQDASSALIPGNTYFWRVRLNPSDGDPSPWSEVGSFSVEGIELTDPSDGTLGTVRPSFNASIPQGYAGIELRISNQEDPNVESANIYSGEVVSLPFEFPGDATQGLLPGESYFWKLMVLDGSGLLAGEPSDYPSGSFSIQGVSINSPSNQSFDVSMTPILMWEGPIGVSKYLVELAFESNSIDNTLYTAFTESSFFSYPDYAPSLDPETKYRWRIVPLDASGNKGSASEEFIFTTSVAQQTTGDEVFADKPGFVLETTDGQNSIAVDLQIKVQNADQYRITIATDQGMSSIVDEGIIQSSESSFQFDDLQWGTGYYVQIQALEEDSELGTISDIVFITTPGKPGSDEQVVIAIELDDGSLSPKISITNLITGAEVYQLNISRTIEMNDLIETVELSGSSLSYTSPEFDYGKTYYFQMIAFDSDGEHGIPSSVVGMFIPNIVPPTLGDDPYSWSAAVPEPHHYALEISTVEDFSGSEVLSDNIQTESFQFSEENLQPGTQYYWRVRAYTENGDPFGGWSQIGSFITSGDQEDVSDFDGEGGVLVSIQTPEPGELVPSTQPGFSWQATESDNITGFEILVSSTEDFSEIAWSNNAVPTTSVQYPSSGAVELQQETDYFWKVRALQEATAIGPFSDPSSFQVSTATTPELTGPLGEAEGVLPFFTWNKIIGAGSYLLIISSSDDMSLIIYENSQVTDIQFQYPDSAPPLEFLTQYYWAVTAIDQDGEPMGDQSAPGSFTTPSGEMWIEFEFDEDGP